MSDEKVRFELRFDAGLFQAVREMAERAEISVNQLMSGLARWAVQNGRPGYEGNPNAAGWVQLQQQPGCVFFGREGYEADPDQVDPRFAGSDKGQVIFNMDFTERHVIRDAEPAVVFEEKPAKSDKPRRKRKR